MAEQSDDKVDKNGIDFDLEIAEEVASATDAAEDSKSKNPLADDSPFMRFVWTSLRALASFVVPLLMFFLIQKNDQLVNAAYDLLHPGTNPYPIFTKGAFSSFLALIIAGIPAFTGLYLGSLLSKFEKLKPAITVAIWCVLMFADTLLLAVVAKYFQLI